MDIFQFNTMANLCFIVLFTVFLSRGLSQTYDVLKESLEERPHFGGVMGKYLNYPGLVYEPNVPDVEGSVMFTMARKSTYDIYTNRIESTLTPFKNEHQNQENFIDCASYRGYRPKEDWNKICRLDMTIDFGEYCTRQEEFGFPYGQPCIAVSLERVLNWLPEPYTNGTVPDKVRQDWYEYAITVHCEGEDPVTKDNLGPVEYYPASGFHFKYFPNAGQDGWNSPVVFARLIDPMPAVALRVTCTAYAKNVQYNDMLHTGKVSFDVVVD